MKKNMKYVMENLGHQGNLVDWLMCINNFFGDEKAEEFCEYYINVHKILRKNDIRNIIPRHSLSVYSIMENEQIAFISVYSLIDRESDFVKNREEGFEKVQKFYRDRSIEFGNKIRKLGYSYVPITSNWKDKNEKDVFQKEYVFLIFSENDNKEIFAKNICDLAKEYNKSKIIITENINNPQPKDNISSMLYDTSTYKILEQYEETTIEIVEKLFSDLSNTKVVFNVPYEKNKRIDYYSGKEVRGYYSKTKQEKIKNIPPQSFNMAMLKQSLLYNFNKEDYNV